MKRVAALLVAVILSACAPQEQAFNAPNVAPRIEQGAFITADGERLPMRSWPLVNPRAIIIAVHGFNDYSNSFTGAGKYFKKRGIATYAYDQRGFGAGPQTGVWAGEQNLTRDLYDFTIAMNKRYPRTPIFLMGESMGGAVVMLAEKECPLPISGMVLSAPAVWGDDTMPVAYRILLWGMAHTLPEAKMTGKNLKIRASNNIPMLRQLGKDPLVIKATRVDAIYGLTHLMDDAYEAPEHIKTRSLLLYGLKDQVIPRAPIDGIKDRFATPTKTIFYDDGYHMLTRDLQGKLVLSDVADWVLKTRRLTIPR